MDDIFKGIDPEKLPDDMKKIYKNLQADYTRKTQELAEQRKGLEAKEQQWMGQLKNSGAMEQEVKQWREWFKSIEAQAGDDKNGKGKKKEPDPDLEALKEHPEVAKLVESLEGKIGSLQTQLQSFDAAFKDQGDRVHRMFSLQSQLNDLMRKDPGLEKDKLLKFAADNRLPDLDKAYKEMYHDKLIDEEVNKRLAAKLAERHTDGIGSGGHVLRRGESTPKTFAEATDQILKQKAQEGTLSFNGNLGSAS